MHHARRAQQFLLLAEEDDPTQNNVLFVQFANAHALLAIALKDNS